MTLGERISFLRRGLGLSQGELGKLIDLSTSCIGMYEQNRRRPDCDVLCRLAPALHTTVDHLLTGAPEPKELMMERLRSAALRQQADLVWRRADGTFRPFTQEDLEDLFRL